MGQPLIGKSRAVVELRRQIEAIAGTRSTVLVTGETGTGKGLAARWIHERSGASPFVHVDCASLSPSLFESELFGHERGAFTGSVGRREGRFERAGDGTVFLDEVAELAPPLQAVLLRALQDRAFERVGGSETLALRARVVAATNRDLRREIEAGRFRADLYYRLQVFELRMPPLRERPADLPLLVAHLGGLRGGAPETTPAFHARLRAHDWPGNVRELANLIERLQVVRPSGPWDAPDLEGLLGPEGPPPTAPPAARERFLARERAALEALLADHRWNVSAAARSLGVSRGALRGRIHRLGL